MKGYQVLNDGRAFWLLLVMAFCPSGLLAQDFRADLAALNKYYQGAAGYNNRIVIEAWLGKSRIYEQTAVMKKSGEVFYYRLGDMEMVLTTTEQVMVHHDQKKILYQAVGSSSSDLVAKLPVRSLDSVMTAFDSVGYYGATGGVKLYRLILKQGVVKQADIYLDEQDKSLRKVIYSYDAKAVGEGYKSVVTFIPQAATSEEGLLKVSTYVHKKGKQLLPASKYHQYTITVVDNEQK